jgi:hypothetical protein
VLLALFLEKHMTQTQSVSHQRTLVLSVPVKTTNTASPEEIAAIVQRLIDIGLVDAHATLEDKEADLEPARLATDLEIGPVSFTATADKVIGDHLVVDGTDDGGNFAGDGEHAPFVVFDVDLQRNIAGPFDTRVQARMALGAILCGGVPTLDVEALRAYPAPASAKPTLTVTQ